MQTAIQFEQSADGIVTLTFDVPGKNVNTFTDELKERFEQCVAQLESEKDSIKGVILTSAKETFFAGGDLNRLFKLQPSDAEKVFDNTERGKKTLRRLEQLGKPVVAALNGTALGGGFEIALACHYRIVLDKPKIQLGLPEASLGLLPGFGGIARMNRLLGLAASQPYLQDGRLMSPAAAKQVGLVHELAATPEEMMEMARTWITQNPISRQPWDVAGFVPMGGWNDSTEAKRWIAAAPSQIRAKHRGLYPAVEAILCASVEGMQVDFDTACRIETRYFVGLVTGKVSKNIINTFWFTANQIKSGVQRPTGVPKRTVHTLAVLGAGMMGKGIAYVSAARGIEVWVKDASVETARGVITAADRILAKRVEKGEISEGKRQEVLSRIHPAETYAELAHVDMVIEAVPENPVLKEELTRSLEPLLRDDAIWASNTSTLPITGLAGASKRPDRFIGTHFFSPVDRMPLVEIIKGARTSSATLAQTLDFVMQIGKTPIVVNDSRGFFTSRVFSTFTREGVAMVGEGQDPASIEAAAIAAGFPVGALAVSDEVTLTLSLNNRRITREAYLAEGKTWHSHMADTVLERMVEGLERKGRTSGGGFYNFHADGTKSLWPGLTENFYNPEAQIPQQDKIDRLLFSYALESVRVLEEGVLDSVGDGNIGSVLGVGFPRWTGGVFQFLNHYGLQAAVERAEYLATRYSQERFTPPTLLRDKAARAEYF